MTIAIPIAVGVVVALAGALLVLYGVSVQRRRLQLVDAAGPLAARDSAPVLAPAAAPSPVRAPSASGSGPLVADRFRVLIVDEDAMAGQTIARLMRGHETVVVKSGEAALATLAADDQFDVILAALTMFSMSGVALAAAIADRHPALRARMVFLVGGAATSQTQRLLALSDVRWVTKPVQYAQLAICVSEVVEAARLVATSPHARA